MAIAFLNNITFSGGAQSEKLRLENLSGNPASGNEGQLYFNTATFKVLVYANGGWADLDGANDFLTGLSFNTGDGVLTATIPNQSNVTVDLDGRYALSSSIPGTIVESVGLAMPSAFTVSNSPVTSTGTLTVTGAGATSQYIDGTGALQTFPTIPTVPSNIVETIDTTNGTYINLTPTTATDGDVTVTADLSAIDGTAAAGERYLTKTNKWATVASIPGTYTWTAAADAGSNRIIQSGNEVDFTGGTNINTENAGGETRFHLDDSITLAGTLTVNGTGQSSFGGQVTVPTTPSAATDAASKSYVDSLVAGGLTFKDGFNAGTGAIDGGGNLTTGASRVAVSIGDFYIVTTAGSFYGSVSLDVGDSVIAKLDAAQGTSDINDWVIVQGDEGVTTFSNSNGGTYVAYGSTNSGAIGAVDIGDVDLTAVDGTSDTATRFLSKDNTWDVPSYTTNSDAKYALTAAAKSGSNVPLTLTGSDGGATTVVNLTEGSNITLTRNSSGQITIASTDTGALGKRIVLNSALSYVGSTDAGGIRTFAINVADSNVFGSGSTAINVKCEVIDASTSGDTAGQTVYADITRGVNAGGQTYGTASLNVAIIGTPANSAYEVLLTYVG